MKRDPFRKFWKTGGSMLSGRTRFRSPDRDDADAGSPMPAPASEPSQAAAPVHPAEPLLAEGRKMTIAEFMTHEPVTTRIDTPLHEALDVLIQRNLSALPVLDDDGRVVGLVNERHLLRALGELEAATIAAIMDTQPVTVDVDEPIVEAVDRLMAINVRQVLVLEKARLVGVVTRADLMPTILKVLRDRSRAAHTILGALV